MEGSVRKAAKQFLAAQQIRPDRLLGADLLDARSSLSMGMGLGSSATAAKMISALGGHSNSATTDLVGSISGLRSPLGLAAEAAVSLSIGSLGESAENAVAGTGKLTDSVPGLTGIDGLLHQRSATESIVGGLIGTLPDAAMGITGIDDLLHQKSAAESIASGLIGAFANLAHISPLAASLGRSRAEDFAAIASPLVTAQESYAAFLSQIPENERILDYGTIGLQSNLLTGAMDHLLELQRADSVALSEAVSRPKDFAWLPRQMAALSSSLSDVFTDQVALVSNAQDHLSASDLAKTMMISTIPVTRYFESARWLVEAETEPDSPPMQPWVEREGGASDLDPLLARIDPEFVQCRHGCWVAYEGDNPDRLRHAAISQRELITGVLSTLVPEVRDENGKVLDKTHIKLRVIEIMKSGGSKSRTKLATEMANAVYAHYVVLSGVVHANQKHADFLRATLHAGEAFLRLILTEIPAGDEDC